MTRSKMLLGVVLGVLTVQWSIPASASDQHHQTARTYRGSHHHAAHATHEGRHQVAQDQLPHEQKGKASVYAANLRGRQMADGTRFDPGSDSAASKQLPLGTRARVTNLKTGDQTTVTVRDRGPKPADRVLDVSPRVAETLRMKRDGVAPVAITPLGPARDDTRRENTASGN